MSRGAQDIVYEHTLPQRDDATESPLEAVADRAGSPEDNLLGEELLEWFICSSSYEVAKTLGLSREKVQRLKVDFLEVDRAEIELARQCLGYSEQDWRKRKLGIALVKAKADAMRERLAA